MQEKSFRLGLIGYPLSHSFSKQYFEHKFRLLSLPDATYDLFPLGDLTHVTSVVEREKLIGFNVTIPYKKKIIPFLTHLSPRVESTGAANTVKITADGWIGENTDVAGFETALNEFLPRYFDGKALILGSGGASAAAQYVLKERNIPFSVVSRSDSDGLLHYRDLKKRVAGYHLIINTTPLGMFPGIHEHPPFPFSEITDKHYLFDMIYNPDKTLFLSLGEERGAKIRNGYTMLVNQAEKAWEFWTK